MWGVKVGVQVPNREIHTHIHLDYSKVEFLSCIKKLKSKSITDTIFVTTRFPRATKALEFTAQDQGGHQ